MTRTFVSLGLIAATIAGVAVPAAAEARNYRGDYGYDRSYDDDRGYGYDDRRAYERQAYREQRRAERRYYRQAERRQSAYNGYDRRGYGGNGYYGEQRYRCSNGSTGTILGAIAGGLIGNSVAGRGDRTLGTVLGGGAGALAGRAIDRNGNRC